MNYNTVERRPQLFFVELAVDKTQQQAYSIGKEACAREYTQHLYMIFPLPQRQILVKVKQALAKTRINFKAELGDFLPRSYQPIVSDLKKTLTAELERYG